MRFINLKLFRAVLISLTAGIFLPTEAATLYVSPSGGQVAPYANWSSAAHVIQDAVDAAANGDEIVVTNGTYLTGGRTVTVIDTNLFTTNYFFNRVVVDKQLVLRSVNGPQFTVIDGQKFGRCVSLASNAFLSGFTLTNGVVNSSGGGVHCDDTTTVVSNCTISGNVASSNNFGGGAYGGTLNNCTLSGNTAAYGGGACNGILGNCIVTGNSANQGGGIYGGTMNNCALTKNSGESGGGAYSGTLRNCTLTGNSGTFGSGVYGGDLHNCIVYYNIGPGGNYDSSSTLSYCCTTPLPVNGANNLSSEPQLASVWHLSGNSPCIGNGSYESVSGVDIDGEPWANPPSIGCDEYWSGSVTGAVSAAFAISYSNVAVGFAVSLESAISGRLSASSWDFGDGVIVSNRPYASHAWAATGNYSVVLRAYNNDYPTGVSGTATVHVVAQPVHYVVGSGSLPSAPYSAWGSAATNIQDAVDAATVPGALVLVSNGVYQTGTRAVYGMSNRVAVTKPLTVQSVNGASVTKIVGFRVPTFVYGSSAVRCVYLTNGAVLSGFTLTNGATQASGDQTRQQSGGAVYCELASAVVSNCVLTGNNAAYRGGGACFGTLNNCTLTGNSVGSYGGGAWSSVLNNCTIASNTAGTGAGAYNCALNNCMLRGNSGSYGGGAYECSLANCTLTNNSAASGGGAYSATLNNCALIGNSVSAYSSYGAGAFDCTLNNCAIASNSAAGTFPYGGGAYSGAANNSILYFNTASNGPNYYVTGQNTLNYCCTMPDAGGIGNITNAPLFVNLTVGNLRLQSSSPCINSGNNGFVSSSTDLDDNPRVVHGTVDMGAYEFQGAGSIISYAWLQQYGLPTDGSADFLDSDHDGLNNWQEWLAGTNPTNALSELKIISATVNRAGFVVTWQSENTRMYYLQRSVDLSQGTFSTIQGNIAGQAGTTSYTDTNAVGSGQFFYRVGVQLP
jgi:parallel beta-helix repeat protein